MRAAVGHEKDSTQRGWFLLVGISIASTLGLGAAVLPLVESRLDGPWPWRHTERVLLGALTVVVMGSVFYLTQQMRRAATVHRELLRTRERAAERAQRQSARLAALLNVSRIMGNEVRLQGVFDAVTRLCREAFTCDQVSLMLVDRDAGDLVVRSAGGHPEPAHVAGARQKLGEGIAGAVAARGEPLLLGPGAPATARLPGVRGQEVALGAAMVVPIRVRDELVGVLNVANLAPGAAYDAEDLQALQVFAENVGACIRHAEQAEWMRQLIHKERAAAPA